MSKYVETVKDKVLLIEDVPSVREVTIDMLNYLGFEVTIAANGSEALEKYALEIKRSGFPFNAVIMDLSPPDGNKNNHKDSHYIQKLLEIDPAAKTVVVHRPFGLECLSRALLTVM